MKLYYTKGACSLVIRIIINEIGFDAIFESVDLKTKKTESGEDFSTINPKGAVPTLQLNNGDTLTENAVILQYLADTAKATELLPALGDFNRYRVLEWLNYIKTELHKSIGFLFNPTLTEDMKDKIVIPIIKTKLRYIDKHLSHHHFLLGDDFTLPDAYLFVMLRWSFYFKFDFKEWPHLATYFAELSKRASIKKSLDQEG